MFYYIESMSVVGDIIELLIGFFVIPQVIAFLLVFVGIYLGSALIALSIYISIVISAVLAYYTYKHWEMVSYGLILYVITNLILFLPFFV
jgi:hypothetical protein|tara:strand:+ start:635 stop:904 length:270 start_codon:yes stop_codon:yes gene_type:complete